jgi:V/A-type H+-transporting ATPase subunit D
VEDRLNIAPTKSNLLDLRRRVIFLDEGYQLLERKREMLTRLVYLQLKEYRNLRKQAHDSIKRAYQSLSITQMRMGTQRLHQVALGMPPALEIKVLPRRNMGVQYPSVEVTRQPLHPVGLLATDVMLDETRKDFAEMAEQMARLAEVESALWRLLEEQRKTQTGQCTEIQHHPPFLANHKVRRDQPGRRGAECVISAQVVTGARQRLIARLQTFQNHRNPLTTADAHRHQRVAPLDAL